MENKVQRIYKNPIQEDEEVLQLIEIVKTYPCLWKDTDEQYKNAEIRHQAWEEVASEMGRSNDAVRSKWKNLTNTFRRIRKEVLKSTVTGSGAADVVHHSWYAYDHMSFLLDTVTPRSALNTANWEESSAMRPGQQPNPPSSSPVASASQVVLDASSPVASTSTMLPGRQNSSRKRKHDDRSQQIAECLGTINRLAEAASAPRPLTKARTLGNFVEAQVAAFEQSDPAFCFRLINVVTSALNQEIERYFAADHM